ncbi:hypothetical protein SARC_03481 [Sphaeroforma arctica JP610]|uniref:DNA repair protein REV1 n=1 Tax=Sphaeroforma arctica JP610 TaxID=667725 RepID=A0A0L0G5L7_9EUKA|nr:hypothetical protein SARC_03481 [Sphaeroforma arctica JP610]KNC84320.1 hypothetical protein SARC_03481 [Sphaeroforma arctica JP610]|eukprot:XP_014158222.1 hypothetical protein SARC_03481 [Sphaeroforma arctica JP610]
MYEDDAFDAALDVDDAFWDEAGESMDGTLESSVSLLGKDASLLNGPNNARANAAQSGLGTHESDLFNDRARRDSSVAGATVPLSSYVRGLKDSLQPRHVSHSHTGLQERTRVDSTHLGARAVGGVDRSSHREARSSHTDTTSTRTNSNSNSNSNSNTNTHTNKNTNTNTSSTDKYMHAMFAGNRRTDPNFREKTAHTQTHTAYTNQNPVTQRKKVHLSEAEQRRKQGEWVSAVNSYDNPIRFFPGCKPPARRELVPTLLPIGAALSGASEFKPKIASTPVRAVKPQVLANDADPCPDTEVESVEGQIPVCTDQRNNETVGGLTREADGLGTPIPTQEHINPANDYSKKQVLIPFGSLTVDRSGRNEPPEVRDGRKRRWQEDYSGKQYMNDKKRKLQQENAQIGAFILVSDGVSPEDRMQSTLLKGKVIYVTGYTQPSADELKVLVLRYGGTWQHFFKKSVCTHIIATSLSHAKSSKVRKDKVVTPDWLVDSVAANRVLPIALYQLFKPEGQSMLSFADPTADKSKPNGKARTKNKANLLALEPQIVDAAEIGWVPQHKSNERHDLLADVPHKIADPLESLAIEGQLNGPIFPDKIGVYENNGTATIGESGGEDLNLNRAPSDILPTGLKIYSSAAKGSIGAVPIADTETVGDASSSISACIRPRTRLQSPDVEPEGAGTRDTAREQHTPKGDHADGQSRDTTLDMKEWDNLRTYCHSKQYDHADGAMGNTTPDGMRQTPTHTDKDTKQMSSDRHVSGGLHKPRNTAQPSNTHASPDTQTTSTAHTPTVRTKGSITHPPSHTEKHIHNNTPTHYRTSINKNTPTSTRKIKTSFTPTSTKRTTNRHKHAYPSLIGLDALSDKREAMARRKDENREPAMTSENVLSHVHTHTHTHTPTRSSPSSTSSHGSHLHVVRSEIVNSGTAPVHSGTGSTDAIGSSVHKTACVCDTDGGADATCSDSSVYKRGTETAQRSEDLLSRTLGTHVECSSGADGSHTPPQREKDGMVILGDYSSSLDGTGEAQEPTRAFGDLASVLRICAQTDGEPVNIQSPGPGIEGTASAAERTSNMEGVQKGIDLSTGAENGVRLQRLVSADAKETVAPPDLFGPCGLFGGMKAHASGSERERTRRVGTEHLQPTNELIVSTNSGHSSGSGEESIHRAGPEQTSTLNSPTDIFVLGTYTEGRISTDTPGTGIAGLSARAIGGADATVNEEADKSGTTIPKPGSNKIANLGLNGPGSESGPKTMTNAMIKKQTDMPSRRLMPPPRNQDTQKKLSSIDNPGFVDQFFGQSRLSHLARTGAAAKNYVTSVIRAKPRRTEPEIRIPLEARVIMHLDMDSFFVSASLLSQPPHFKNLPVAVCHAKAAKSDSSSEIASVNYVARKFGVKSGMLLGKASRLCPKIITVPYDYEANERVSKIVCQDLRCSASVGIGNSKLMARLATREAKPDGVCYLSDRVTPEVLREMAVENLPGVGWSKRKQLNNIGVLTVEDMRHLDTAVLQEMFGTNLGRKLRDAAHGIDREELTASKTRKTLATEISWGVRFTDQRGVDEFMGNLVQNIRDRLKAECLFTGSVTLKIKETVDAKATAHKYLGHGPCYDHNQTQKLGGTTDEYSTLLRTCTQLFREIGVAPTDVRGIGITLTRLVPMGEEGSVAGTKAGVSVGKGTMEQFFMRKAVGNATSAQLALSEPTGDAPQSEPHSRTNGRVASGRTMNAADTATESPVKGLIPTVAGVDVVTNAVIDENRASANAAVEDGVAVALEDNRGRTVATGVYSAMHGRDGVQARTNASCVGALDDHAENSTGASTEFGRVDPRAAIDSTANKAMDWDQGTSERLATRSVDRVDDTEANPSVRCADTDRHDEKSCAENDAREGEKYEVRDVYRVTGQRGPSHTDTIGNRVAESVTSNPGSLNASHQYSTSGSYEGHEHVGLDTLDPVVRNAESVSSTPKIRAPVALNSATPPQDKITEADVKVLAMHGIDPRTFMELDPCTRRDVLDGLREPVSDTYVVSAKDNDTTHVAMESAHRGNGIHMPDRAETPIVSSVTGDDTIYLSEQRHVSGDTESYTGTKRNEVPHLRKPSSLSVRGESVFKIPNPVGTAVRAEGSSAVGRIGQISPKIQAQVQGPAIQLRNRKRDGSPTYEDYTASKSATLVPPASRHSAQYAHEKVRNSVQNAIGSAQNVQNSVQPVQSSVPSVQCLREDALFADDISPSRWDSQVVRALPLEMQRELERLRERTKLDIVPQLGDRGDNTHSCGNSGTSGVFPGSSSSCGTYHNSTHTKTAHGTGGASTNYRDGVSTTEVNSSTSTNTTADRTGGDDQRRFNPDYPRSSSICSSSITTGYVHGSGSTVNSTSTGRHADNLGGPPGNDGNSPTGESTELPEPDYEASSYLTSIAAKGKLQAATPTGCSEFGSENSTSRVEGCSTYPGGVHHRHVDGVGAFGGDGAVRNRLELGGELDIGKGHVSAGNGAGSGENYQHQNSEREVRGKMVHEVGIVS